MTLRVLARRWRSYRIAGSTVGTRTRKHADWKAASILHPQLESEAMVCGSLTATTHTYSTITITAAPCAATALSSYGVFDWWTQWSVLWDNWSWNGVWGVLICTASYRITAHTGPLLQGESDTALPLPSWIRPGSFVCSLDSQIFNRNQGHLKDFFFFLNAECSYTLRYYWPGDFIYNPKNETLEDTQVTWYLEIGKDWWENTAFTQKRDMDTMGHRQDNRWNR